MVNLVNNINFSIDIFLNLTQKKTAKVAPFHSIKESVHHDDSSCTEGNNIEKVNRREGTGDKPKCKNCK